MLWLSWCDFWTALVLVSLLGTPTMQSDKNKILYSSCPYFDFSHHFPIHKPMNISLPDIEIISRRWSLRSQSISTWPLRTANTRSPTSDNPGTITKYPSSRRHILWPFVARKKALSIRVWAARLAASSSVAGGLKRLLSMDPPLWQAWPLQSSFKSITCVLFSVLVNVSPVGWLPRSKSPTFESSQHWSLRDWFGLE